MHRAVSSKLKVGSASSNKFVKGSSLDYDFSIAQRWENFSFAEDGFLLLLKTF
jgi:hypothetical protein